MVRRAKDGTPRRTRDEWLASSEGYDAAAADFQSLFLVMQALQGTENNQQMISSLATERVFAALLSWKSNDAQAGPVTEMIPPTPIGLLKGLLIELGLAHHDRYRVALSRALSCKAGRPKKDATPPVAASAKSPGRKPAFGTTGADLATYVAKCRDHGRTEAELVLLRDLAVETFKANGRRTAGTGPAAQADAWAKTLQRYRKKQSADKLVKNPIR